MDFALLNVNDKSISKSTPNLVATDAAEAVAATGLKPNNKSDHRRKFSEARLKPPPWKKLFGGRKGSLGNTAAAAEANGEDGDAVNFECIVSVDSRQFGRSVLILLLLFRHIPLLSVAIGSVYTRFKVKEASRPMALMLEFFCIGRYQYLWYR